MSFTTDDIAISVEIRGLYDGTAVYLLKSGELVNRFRLAPGWSPRHIAGADEWIAKFGAKLRKENADLLDVEAVNRG